MVRLGAAHVPTWSTRHAPQRRAGGARQGRPTASRRKRIALRKGKSSLIIDERQHLRSRRAPGAHRSGHRFSWPIAWVVVFCVGASALRRAGVPTHAVAFHGDELDNLLDPEKGIAGAEILCVPHPCATGPDPAATTTHKDRRSHETTAASHGDLRPTDFSHPHDYGLEVAPTISSCLGGWGNIVQPSRFTQKHEAARSRESTLGVSGTKWPRVSHTLALFPDRIGSDRCPASAAPHREVVLLGDLARKTSSIHSGDAPLCGNDRLLYVSELPTTTHAQQCVETAHFAHIRGRDWCPQHPGRPATVRRG